MVGGLTAPQPHADAVVLPKKSVLDVLGERRLFVRKRRVAFHHLNIDSLPVRDELAARSTLPEVRARIDDRVIIS